MFIRYGVIFLQGWFQIMQAALERHQTWYIKNCPQIIFFILRNLQNLKHIYKKIIRTRIFTT